MPGRCINCVVIRALLHSAMLISYPWTTVKTAIHSYHLREELLSQYNLRARWESSAQWIVWTHSKGRRRRLFHVFGVPPENPTLTWWSELRATTNSSCSVLWIACHCTESIYKLHPTRMSRAIIATKLHLRSIIWLWVMPQWETSARTGVWWPSKGSSVSRQVVAPVPGRHLVGRVRVLGRPVGKKKVNVMCRYGSFQCPLEDQMYSS